MLDSITTVFKGRISIPDLIEAPFREVHELYRILINKIEADKKAAEERKKKEEEEAKKQEQADIKAGRLNPMIRRGEPTDDINKTTTPSPLESEELEEVLEELAEGGAL